MLQRSQRLLLATLVLGGVLWLGRDLGVSRAGTSRAAAAPERVEQSSAKPALLLSGLQLADRVRYAVSLVRPPETGLSNLQVVVIVPANAEVVESLQTTGRTVFLGNANGALTWAAPGYAPGEPADAFSFSLRRVPDGAFSAKATWTDDAGNSAEQDLTVTPTVTAANVTAADVTLNGTATSGELIPADDTGVQLRVVSGSVPEGTVLHVRLLGADANPPTGVGSPWWCGELSIDGLPEGAAVAVVLPARQPLPGGLQLDVFGQRSGQWQLLADQGQVSADGQFVSFLHTGGIMAAGTKGTLQPMVLSTTTSTSPSPPHFTNNVTGTFLLRNFTSGSWTITAKNDGGTAAHEVYLCLTAGYKCSTNPGAIDYSSITVLSGSASGVSCRIVQGSALFGSKAECTLQTLNPGQQISVRLNGGVTITTNHSEEISSYVVDNFSSGFAQEYQVGGLLVSLNP
jgi:hypothetical protein